MANLYELTSEMEDLLEDSEADEQALARVFGDIQKGAENCCKFLTVLDGDIEVFKAEEKRLADRRKALEHKRESVKRYLQENMERLQIDTIKAGTFSLKLQDSPPRVVVDEETAIPARFFTVIPQTLQLNKKEVADAIKRGEIVTGCHTEQSRSLRIR